MDTTLATNWENLLRSDQTLETLLAYTDWLEESGDIEAARISRVFIKHNVFPEYNELFGDTWTWYAHDHSTPPHQGLAILPVEFQKNGFIYGPYKTYREAIVGPTKPKDRIHQTFYFRQGNSDSYFRITRAFRLFHDNYAQALGYSKQADHYDKWIPHFSLAFLDNWQIVSGKLQINGDTVNVYCHVVRTSTGDTPYFLVEGQSRERK